MPYFSCSHCAFYSPNHYLIYRPQVIANGIYISVLVNMDLFRAQQKCHETKRPIREIGSFYHIYKQSDQPFEQN